MWYSWPVSRYLWPRCLFLASELQSQYLGLFYIPGLSFMSVLICYALSFMICTMSHMSVLSFVRPSSESRWTHQEYLRYRSDRNRRAFGSSWVTKIEVWRFWGSAKHFMKCSFGMNVPRNSFLKLTIINKWV